MKKITTYDVKLVKEECKLYDLETTQLKSSSIAGKIIQTVCDLNSATVEKFGIICVDAGMNIIGIHIVTVGGLTESLVDVRGIFQRALLNNAASIFIFHNHPGGSPSPSVQDIEVTNKVQKAGKIMGVKLIDHIIVFDGGYYSFNEKGMMGAC